MFPLTSQSQHGHGMQYAGNVLVYGAMSPCDGDWFGGINERNAAAFLEGIINAEVGCLVPCAFLHTWLPLVSTRTIYQLRNNKSCPLERRVWSA